MKNQNNLLHQLQGMKNTTAAPLVRIESFNRQRVQHVLDLGAEGVMCPRINTLKKIINAANKAGKTIGIHLSDLDDFIIIK